MEQLLQKHAIARRRERREASSRGHGVWFAVAWNPGMFDLSGLELAASLRVCSVFRLSLTMGEEVQSNKLAYSPSARLGEGILGFIGLNFNDAFGYSFARQGVLEAKLRWFACRNTGAWGEC